MITIEAPEVNKVFYFPENLGECDSRQYAMLCRLVFQFQNKEIDIYQFKRAAVYHILGWKADKEPQTDRFNSNVYELTRLVDNFFEEAEDGSLIIKQGYAHNPIPVIDTGWKKFYGPDDYFRNVTFGQYIDALNVFGLYQIQPGVELLYDLAAILYQRKNKPYCSKLVPKIARRMRFTDFGYVYGAYMLLASFQFYLNNATVMYEGKEIDLSILFKSSKEKSPIAGLGMKGTSYVLAETGILGSLKEVKQTDMWEVLFLMYNVKKADLDAMREAKKENKNGKGK